MPQICIDTSTVGTSFLAYETCMLPKIDKTPIDAQIISTAPWSFKSLATKPQHDLQ